MATAAGPWRRTAARTPAAALCAYQAWCSEVTLLGLKDNDAKLQLWARTHEQRLELQRAFQREVRDHMVVLGTDVHYDPHHHLATTLDQDDHEHLQAVRRRTADRRRQPPQPPGSDEDTDRDSDDALTLEQLAWQQMAEAGATEAPEDSDDQLIADLPRAKRPRTGDGTDGPKDTPPQHAYGTRAETTLQGGQSSAPPPDA